MAPFLVRCLSFCFHAAPFYQGAACGPLRICGRPNSPTDDCFTVTGQDAQPHVIKPIISEYNRSLNDNFTLPSLFFRGGSSVKNSRPTHSQLCLWATSRRYCPSTIPLLARSREDRGPHVGLIKSPPKLFSNLWLDPIPTALPSNSSFMRELRVNCKASYPDRPSADP